MTPDDYAELKLPDQWIEDAMQDYEARWIVDQTKGCDSILELGYGSGIVATSLLHAGKSVTIVDGSSKFIQKAAGLPGRIAAVQSMFEEFHPLGRFDCVIASFILEHVMDPLTLLKRIRKWSNRLIVVIGNANSFHRRLAVLMGIQPDIYTLSERDKAVGHFRVYDFEQIVSELSECGWMPSEATGFMFKPLPNAMMAGFDPKLIRAMNEILIPAHDAANIGMVCHAV